MGVWNGMGFITQEKETEVLLYQMPRVFGDVVHGTPAIGFKQHGTHSHKTSTLRVKSPSR